MDATYTSLGETLSSPPQAIKGKHHRSLTSNSEEVYVDHYLDPIQLSNYSDLSMFEERLGNNRGKDALSYVSSPTTSSNLNVGVHGGLTSFPGLLYQALSELESQGHNFIRWMPHGRAFMVDNPEQFIAYVTPR